MADWIDHARMSVPRDAVSVPDLRFPGQANASRGRTRLRTEQSLPKNITRRYMTSVSRFGLAVRR